MTSENAIKSAAVQIAMYQNVREHAVKQFAEYLKEYAKACKESGYDGIGEIDIDEKLREFLNK